MTLNVREVIVDLLDKYNEMFGLTRRQVADAAGVNMGQLSNWLRNAGPLSPLKEGRVAQFLWERVSEALPRMAGSPDYELFWRIARSLEYYGSRRRYLAAQPDAAQEGKPISPANPYYVKRTADLELESRLKGDGLFIQISVIGGPKTGRTSLLLAAQEMFESTGTVIFVNLGDYIPCETKDYEDEKVSKHFCQWLAETCESQLTGSFRETFNGREAARWALSNILPNSPGGKCLIIFDQIEALTRRDANNRSLEFNTLDRVLLDLLNGRVRNPALNKLGFIFSVDLEWSGLPRSADGSHTSSVVSGRMHRVNINNMSEHEVGKLLQARRVDLSELSSWRDEAWSECEGQAFLTQSFVAASRDIEEGRKNVGRSLNDIADAVWSRWPTEFTDQVVEEVEMLLGQRPGNKPDDAARKALVATGLCMTVESTSTEDPYPIRVINNSLLADFKDRLNERKMCDDNPQRSVLPRA